jgi:hypothetical protein
MEHISAPIARIMESVIDKMTEAATPPFSPPPPPRTVPSQKAAEDE